MVDMRSGRPSQTARGAAGHRAVHQMLEAEQSSKTHSHREFPFGRRATFRPSSQPFHCCRLAELLLLDPRSTSLAQVHGVDPLICGVAPPPSSKCFRDFKSMTSDELFELHEK